MADRETKQNPLMYSCCKCKAEFDHLADLSQHIMNMCYVKRPSPMITHQMNRRKVSHADNEREFFRAGASKRAPERRVAQSDADLEISQILPNPIAMKSNPECMDSTNLTDEKVDLWETPIGPSCQSSSCPYCHMSLSTNCDLKRHLSTGCETFLAFKKLTRSSLNQKHACKYCLLKFKSAYSLKTHKLTYGKFCKANRQYARLQKVAKKVRNKLIIEQRLPVRTGLEPQVQHKTTEIISESPPNNQSKVSVRDSLYEDIEDIKILESEDHPNIISVDVVKQHSNEQSGVVSNENLNICNAAHNPTPLPVMTNNNVNPTSDASCDTLLVPSTTSGDTSNMKTCIYCHQSFSFYYKLKKHMSKNCPTGLAFKKKHRVTLFQKNICKYCSLKFKSCSDLKVHMLVYCKFLKTKKLSANILKKKNRQNQKAKTRKIHQKKERLDLSKKPDPCTNSKSSNLHNNIQEPYSVPAETKKSEATNSDQCLAIVSNTSENNSSRKLEFDEIEHDNNLNICNPLNSVESVITIKKEPTTEASENENSVPPSPAPVEVTEISGKEKLSCNDRSEISRKSIVEPPSSRVCVVGSDQNETSEANPADLEQINIKLEPDQDLNFESMPIKVEEITCADICGSPEPCIKFEDYETPSEKCDNLSEPNDLVKVEPEGHQELDVTANAEIQLPRSCSNISTKSIKNIDLQQNRTELKGTLPSTFQNSVFENISEISKPCAVVERRNENTKSSKDVKLPEARNEAEFVLHNTKLSKLQDESETSIKLASESSEFLNKALSESEKCEAQCIKAGSKISFKISHTATKENVKSQQVSTEASSSNFEKTEAAGKDAIMKYSEPLDTIAELSKQRSKNDISTKATLECSEKWAKQSHNQPFMSVQVKSKTDKIVAKRSAFNTSLEPVNLENTSLNTVVPSILSADILNCSNQTDKLSSDGVPTRIGETASKNIPFVIIHDKKNDSDYDNKEGECLQQTTKILDNNTVELAPQQVQRNVSSVIDSGISGESVKATKPHTSKPSSDCSKKLSQKAFSDEQDKLNAQLPDASDSSHSTPEYLNVLKTCSSPDGGQQKSKSLQEHNEKKLDQQDVSNTQLQNSTSERSIKPSNNIKTNKLVCPFCNEEKTSQSDLSTHKMLYCKMANRMKIALKESIDVGAVSVSCIDTNTLVPVINEPDSSDLSKIAVCDKLNSLKESNKFGAVPVTPIYTNMLVPVITETDSSVLSKSVVCDNKEKCRVKGVSDNVLDKACYICGSEFYNITALRKHQSKYCKLFYNPNVVASNNIDSLTVNSSLKVGEIQQTKEQNLRIFSSEEKVKGKHTTSAVAATYPESTKTSNQEGSLKAKISKLSKRANVRVETLCNICGYQFGSQKGNTISSSSADTISKGCRCMDNILLNVHQEYPQPLVDAGTKTVVDKSVFKVKDVDVLDIVGLQPKIATKVESIDRNQEGSRKFYKCSLSVNNRLSETVSKVPSFKNIISKPITSGNLESFEVKKSSHTQVVFDLRDTLNKKSFKAVKGILPHAAESTVNTPGGKTGNSKPPNANSVAAQVSCLNTSSSDPDKQINTLTENGTKNQVDDLKLHVRKLHTEKHTKAELLKSPSPKETLDKKGAGELDVNTDPGFSRLHKDWNKLTTRNSSSSFEKPLQNAFSENSVKRRPTLYCETCGTSVRNITELDYPRCGHKEIILKCPMCKYQYPNINKLISHMDADHSDNELIEKELPKTSGLDSFVKYYCCFCGFSYTLIKNLVNHMTERHKFFHRQTNKNVLPPVIYPSDPSIKGFACAHCDNTVFLTLDSLFDHEDRSKCHKKNCRLYENLSRNYNPVEEQKFEHICFICKLGFISFKSQQIHMLESSRHDELQREAWDSARLDRNKNRQDRLPCSYYPKRCFSDTKSTSLKTYCKDTSDLRMTAKVATKSPGNSSKYSTSTFSRILTDPNGEVLKSDNNEPIPVIDLGHNEVQIEESASGSVQIANLINDETQLKPASSEVACSPPLSTSFTLNTSDLLRILQDPTDADFDSCIETANGKADKQPLLSEHSTKENDYVDSLMQKMHFGESAKDYHCFGCRECFRSQHLLESHSCNGPF